MKAQSVVRRRTCACAQPHSRADVVARGVPQRIVEGTTPWEVAVRALGLPIEAHEF